MKTNILIQTLAAAAVLAGAPAFAASTYVVTVTNGSAMPLSPGAVYVKNGSAPEIQIGQAPTAGFVQLCQTGNPSVRVQELAMERDVTFKVATQAPIMPGESRVIEVEVQDPLTQSLHVEAMYGKTKDVCAVGAVSSHNLYALKQHVVSEVVTKDEAVATGAFSDPALPMGRTYLDPAVCAGQMDAISCLRSLSAPVMGKQAIRFFPGYLSSLTMLLETKYGAAQTQSLLFPQAGGVRLQVQLKH